MLKVTSPEILESIERFPCHYQLATRAYIRKLFPEKNHKGTLKDFKRLRKMALAKGCNFSISNGTQILINREKFDKYMDKIEKV